MYIVISPLCKNDNSLIAVMQLLLTNLQIL